MHKYINKIKLEIAPLRNVFKVKSLKGCRIAKALALTEFYNRVW